MRSLYGVYIGMLFSKIWRPLCSLFLKFTLASGVFARAGVERERYSKTSERGRSIIPSPWMQGTTRRKMNCSEYVPLPDLL